MVDLSKQSICLFRMIFFAFFLPLPRESTKKTIFHINLHGYMGGLMRKMHEGNEDLKDGTCVTLSIRVWKAQKKDNLYIYSHTREIISLWHIMELDDFFYLTVTFFLQQQ